MILGYPYFWKHPYKLKHSLGIHSTANGFLGSPKTFRFVSVMSRTPLAHHLRIWRLIPRDCLNKKNQKNTYNTTYSSSKFYMKLIEAAEYKIERLSFRFFGGPYGVEKKVIFCCQKSYHFRVLSHLWPWLMYDISTQKKKTNQHLPKAGDETKVPITWFCLEVSTKFQTHSPQWWFEDESHGRIH